VLRRLRVGLSRFCRSRVWSGRPGRRQHRPWRL